MKFALDCMCVGKATHISGLQSKHFIRPANFTCRRQISLQLACKLLLLELEHVEIVISATVLQ